MTFFPDPPEDEPISRGEPIPPPPPPWRGEPEDVLPGVVPFEVVIGRGPDTVVHLLPMRAFPTGVAIELVVHWRPRGWGHGIYHAIVGGPDAEGRLLWGVEFGDGQKVTNVGPPAYPTPPVVGPDGDVFAAEAAVGPPPRPALTIHGGSGLPGIATSEYWLWPLPPPGVLTIVCEWPERGIEQTRTRLDTAPILEAAERSQPLWSDG